MAVLTERLLFYHIPKTGGVWVRAALNRAVLSKIRKHAPLVEGWKKPLGLNRWHCPPPAIPEELKAHRFQFCFVRRPLEWYRSFWCYRLARDPVTPGRRYPFPPDSLWVPSFSEFLDNVLNEFPCGFLTEFFRLYTGPTGHGLVDFVGRQEKLRADLARALRLSGEKVVAQALWSIRPTNRAAAHPEIGKKAVADEALIRRLNTTEGWVLETFYA